MNQQFWDKVYSEKKENEVSWFQEFPEISLSLISTLKIPIDANIIDVGAGSSRLIDHFISQEYSHITLLDISEVSLQNVKSRLGDSSKSIKFIVSNITDFESAPTFDLWHDRAAFHFLTDDNQIQKYLEIANSSIRSGGYLIIGTFSKNGPEKCSGLPIRQYSEKELENTFSKYFTKVDSKEHVHVTPWNSSQHFVFCVFKKN